MKEIKNHKDLLIKAPIIMSIISYLSFIVYFILGCNKFSIVLIESFISWNLNYYIICIGIIIYFLNLNKKKKKSLSINILISLFIIPAVYQLVGFIYNLINFGFNSAYLANILLLSGFVIYILYLSNIKNNNKLVIVSTILMIISTIYPFRLNQILNIYTIIDILFIISFAPYFYYFYEKDSNKEKIKISFDSEIGLKIVYSLIIIISFVLLFVPSYGYDFGYGYSNSDNYFRVGNISLIVILVSSLIFIWTNNKKTGFYVSLCYPIKMILFAIIYCFSDEDYCINWVGITNIILSIISVLPYFIFSRTEGDFKEERKMKDEKVIYEIDGNMGRILKVYEDRCVISTKAGVKSFVFAGGLMGATRGDKEFYYSDITSVQFKNLKTTSGYLQFEYAGSRSGNNYMSENSFPFSATIGTQKYNDLREAMPPIYEYILEKVRENKKTKTETIVQQVSSADELLKFKKLLDEGIISQEEFDAKKKQLLDL